ncbi:MAG: HAD hydrolase family protein, partial [Oscillospiraceae bacterium]|nr:HAD hydrolase family protein [Oscillospiraceae bacterium]
PDKLLNGLEPDYWLCAAGAQVLDRDGTIIASSRMRPEELEALTDFCTKNGYPLILHFSDGPYACAGYERIRQALLAQGQIPMIRDGTERMRHLLELPFSAAALMPEEAEPQFQAEYGELGLRFPYYNDSGCDILRPGQDKALGLTMLLKHTGLRPEECVSVGDGNNDVGILQAAGLSFCVEGGAASALAAADQVCPASADYGVAAVCRMVWPEAFGE